MAGPEEDRLLRWYPEPWRRRYGAELLAMVEDTTGGAAPGRRLRWSLAAAGVRERARRNWAIGSSASPEERIRGGAALVLWGWAVMVLAGVSFAKAAEHWSDTVPPGGRALPAAAMDAMQVLAAAGAAVLLAVVAVATPSVARALRTGLWREVRSPATVAEGLLVAWLATAVAVIVWAHQLTPAARDGGSSAYTALVAEWGVVTTGTVAAWAVLAVRVERQLPASPRLLKVERTAGVGAAALLAGVTAVSSLWWAGIAASAPWVLHGAAPASRGSAWTWRLGATELAMVAATMLGGLGVARMVSARRRAPAG